MGLFRSNATCAICGKTVGLIRYKIEITEDGKELWKCPECARKGGMLNVNFTTGEVSIAPENFEIRKKCNVCGHVFCYSIGDLARNEEKKQSAMWSSVAGIAGALGGYYTASAVHSGNASNALGSVIDYNRCPMCGSRNILTLSWGDECCEMQPQSIQTKPAQPPRLAEPVKPVQSVKPAKSIQKSYESLPLSEKKRLAYWVNHKEEHQSLLQKKIEIARKLNSKTLSIEERNTLKKDLLEIEDELTRPR